MMNSIDDRIAGCFALGALGDSFGYVVEFVAIDAIKRKYNGLIQFSDVENWTENDELGEQTIVVSDDTQMTMFTAEGIVNGLKSHIGQTFDQGRNSANLKSSIIEHIRLAYIDWYSTQFNSMTADEILRRPHSLISFNEMYRQRAPGQTCLTACHSGAYGFTDPSARINHSMGCGGVMRVAPLGFLPYFEDEEIFELGNQSAALTHGHPMGFLPAGAMAAIINCICRGQGIAEAVRNVRSMLGAQHESGPLCDAIDVALMYEDKGTMHYQAMEMLGGGWVGHECLAMGIAAAILDAPIEDRMTISANHSGDSDSTASITGQLIGAFEGFRKLQTTLPKFAVNVEKLDIIRPLNMITGRLSLAISSIPSF